MAFNKVGKVSHYASNGNVSFSFDEIDQKKSDQEVSVVSGYNLDLAFEIYKKFKDAKVRVTVEKVK